ncbi:MAG: hypothetical protein HUJ94_04800 [Bacteroidales bacterium]|nr:hypothetical protein [Bacteroidales bacterium]
MKTRNITIFLLAAIAAAACISPAETAYAEQETKIDSFINGLVGKDSTITVFHNGGSSRVTLVHGDGEEASASATVSLIYGGFTFQGNFSKNNLVTTNDEQMAKDAGWKAPDDTTGILTVNLKDDVLLDGLKNGLAGVRGGEECYIVFSGKYGHGKKGLGMVPANSAMLWHITVESISNE